MLKLVSIHVPKTAGTSLWYAMKASHSVTTHYNIKTEKSDAVIIHGHFSASKMRSEYPNLPFVSVVRDPEQQVLSNHSFLRRKKSHLREDPRVHEDMSIEEFIIATSNEQSSYIDEEIDLIGVTSKLEDYVFTLNDRYSLEVRKPPKRNVGIRREIFKMNKTQLDLLEEFYSEDIALYNKASKEWA